MFFENYLKKDGFECRYIDGYVPAGEVRLSYRRWAGPVTSSGPTMPSCLLIHGLASGLRIWDLLAMELLVRGAGEIIALDQRGHGLSDKPDHGYNTGQIVADDFALAESLELEKPVLAGHSWGATIALAYAASHPEAASALVLVDGAFGNMHDRPGLTWEQVEKELAPPDFAGTPRQAFLDFYREGRAGHFFKPIWSPQLEDMVLNLVEVRPDDTVGPRLSRANHMQILRSLWETSNTELAARITCPVIMISAESQPPEDDERSREWLRQKRAGIHRMEAAFSRSPLFEHIEMPDTVHDIPLQRPRELAELITGFLRRSGVNHNNS